jgi:PIN domain nuclease of toxin-antitoxin system
MTFLLDTNVWLWWTYGSTERFSIELRRDIASLHADVFVSTASLWEIAIKGALRKLEFPAIRERTRCVNSNANDSNC